MTSVICTLFEEHYHYGVSALTNSLYKQGFRGDIYAGYRGSLPSWVETTELDNTLNWNDATIFKVTENLQIHFLPLDTSYHLTNYKPDFMLRLWSSIVINADAMFYFDPDIVLVAPWNYFEEWVTCGIAVCEDIKSPLENFHPRRVGWRKHYIKYGIELNFKNSIYVNGGFLGICKSNIAFLEKWQLLQQYMAEQIGGLERSSITTHTKLPLSISTEFSPFGATDQDALNATIEACNFDISYMRKEAMALSLGGPILIPHALGQPKPWQYSPFKSFFKGIAPRYVDKEFWASVEFPIKAFSKIKFISMIYSMKFLSLLSRFYSK